MLKTIQTSQVTLGMHIHALKGAWVDHPFWKTKFVLNDPDDLKKLQSSIIKEVVIDVSKGVDVVEAETISLSEENPQPQEYPQDIPQEKIIEEAKISPIRVSAAEENARAKKIIKSSKKAVASMFHEMRMGKAVNQEAAKQLVDDIADSVARNEGALISLV
jgi:hypothetical protein